MYRIFVLILIASAGLVRPLLAQSVPEYRALWVDAWGAGFLDSAQTTKLVADARRYNFNALVVQMRRRGDAFYFPQAPNLEPRTTAIASNYDALADLIAKAHTGTPRLEVHCWVPANLVWSSETNPTNPNHVVNRHPGYLMKNFAGATFMAEGKYLDPGHPDAMQWNLNMALDIVRRYDVDGFHWDYIRYPQQDAGYNDVALARYRAEYGNLPKPSTADTRFSNWRRRQVTDFLRWANSELLAVKPKLIISTAVFANRTDAFANRFQDWATWNSEGLIDLCMPMNYTADNAGIFAPRLNDAVSRQGVRWVVNGFGAYLNTKENSVTQMQMIRAAGLKGSVLYSYRTPNSGTVNQTGTFDHIKANFQPTWQPTPALPWKANPTRGIVKGRVRRAPGGELLYNATTTVQDTATRTQLTEPHGTFAFFETSPGVRLVSASFPGYVKTEKTAQVTAGAVTHLDLWLTNAFDVPVVITGVEVPETGPVIVEASGAAGMHYALEQSFDLINWSEITNTIPANADFTILDPTLLREAKNYRIKKLRNP